MNVIAKHLDLFADYEYLLVFIKDVQQLLTEERKKILTELLMGGCSCYHCDIVSLGFSRIFDKFSVKEPKE